MFTVESFSNRDSALLAASNTLFNALQRQLETKVEVAMVVSGGTTPAPIYANLAGRCLQWNRVTAVLSDERWVDAYNPASNEGMLRDTLLVKCAKQARVLSVYDDALTIEEGCASVSRQIEQLPLPFAASLLGMGADGHFASLFPDSLNLQDGLTGSSICIPVSTSASDHPRVSLTLNTLKKSDEILLVIFGNDKRRVFESDDPALPITYLKQQATPVTVYWAA